MKAYYKGSQFFFSFCELTGKLGKLQIGTWALFLSTSRCVLSSNSQSLTNALGATQASLSCPMILWPPSFGLVQDTLYLLIHSHLKKKECVDLCSILQDLKLAIETINSSEKCSLTSEIKGCFPIFLYNSESPPSGLLHQPHQSKPTT